MPYYSNKIALITGAGSGLGRALALALGRRGAHVVLSDIDPAGCLQAQETILQEGGVAHCLTLDVSKSEAVDQAVEQVVREHGRLDLMINNAGYSVSGEVRHISAEAWRKITDVNFLGVVYGSQAAYGQMIEQGSGQIVNIASIFGLVSAPTAAAYVATKHAVVGFTRSLRHEAEAYGVKVNTVCPGFISTQLFENAHYVGVSKDAMMEGLTFSMLPPERAAEKILQGVAQDREIIAFPRYVKLYRWLDRHGGFLLRAIYRSRLKAHRSLLESSVPDSLDSQSEGEPTVPPKK